MAKVDTMNTSNDENCKPKEAIIISPPAETATNPFILFMSIGVFAYVGVFVRVLLTSFAQQDEMYLLYKLGASYVLPNIVGTFVIGVFTSKIAVQYNNFDALLKGRVCGRNGCSKRSYVQA
jgi:hypothetical protein